MLLWYKFTPAYDKASLTQPTTKLSGDACRRQ
jgi:hypothetical protein